MQGPVAGEGEGDILTFFFFFGPGASSGCKDKVETCARPGAVQAAADPATSTLLWLLEETLRKQNKNLRRVVLKFIGNEIG